MSVPHYRLSTTIIGCLMTLFITTPAWADDIEIYTNSDFNNGVNPNVLFIIDTSGSMDTIDTGATDTRLKIVQDVFGSLMDNFSGTGIDVSVMRFDNNQDSNKQTSGFTTRNRGGYFIVPPLTLNTANKNGIKAAVNALTPQGFTPLAESLYEAAQFYRGSNVKFGNSTNPGTNLDLVRLDPNNAANNNYGVLNPSNTSQYQSPITSQCQKDNYIVMLTDGEPRWDYDADADIRTLAGLNASACGFGESKIGADDCLDELAQYLYTNDQSILDGTQRIRTYTIGFQTNQTLLSDTATNGGGQYFTANNANDLTTAFSSILTDITAASDTFTAPSLAVNVFNRLTHLNEVYFALYQPSGAKAWAGNVKGFTLGADPIDPTHMIFLDKNGQGAIADGVIADSATSLWTTGADAPDGSDVLKGGAASKIPAVNRDVYTYTGAAASAVNSINVTLSTGTNNILHESNTGISNTMLGLAAGVDSTDLLKWARGVNSDGTQRHSMGDPLHSQPIVITYGGTSNNPKSSIFVATNEGFLHAIDGQNGKEQFAFIPQELLSNLDKLKSNNGDAVHPYGLDGSISSWIKDVDGDGIIESAAGDHAYIYVGMRRGGKNYYALDVTDPKTPVLKWIIKGGIASTDYAELAQTWSKPIVATIKFNGNDKQVLIFAGGYDDKEDLTTVPVDHVNVGRAIYIVDAETGNRLWWASASGANANNGDMTYSIPSDIRALDVNNDGYIDRLYVGDMNAQIFRVDIDNKNNSGANNLATVGTIAQLGGIGVDHRRFYNAPDVVLTKKPGASAAYLSVNIGSGYRAHPLNTGVQDRFYSIQDYAVFSKPETYTTLTHGNIYNATQNLIGEGSDAEITEANNSLVDSKGWFINLSGSGEKILAEAVTFNSQIFFTTYTPQATPAGSCSPLPGIGKLYHVNLFDAQPVRNYDSNPLLTKEDRIVKELDKGGIPAPPVIAFPVDKQPALIVGNESMNSVSLQIIIDRTYWTQQ